MTALTGELRRRALAEGFDRVSIAPATRLDRDEIALRRWLDKGQHADMTWMERERIADAEDDSYYGGRIPDEVGSNPETGRTLDDELLAACQAVDEEELIQLAQRFNSVNEQLDAARKQLADRARDQEALEAALDEQQRLQDMLDTTDDRLSKETTTNQRIQDLLDETLGKLSDAESSSASQQEATGGGGLGSLADELALQDLKLREESWTREKSALEATNRALQEEKEDLTIQKERLASECNTLDTQQKILSETVQTKLKETTDLNAKVQYLSASYEKSKNQVGDLKTTIEKNEEEARAVLAKNEMALLTSKNDIATQRQQVQELSDELEASRSFAKRQRKDYEEEILKAHAHSEDERVKEIERRNNQGKEFREEIKVLNEKLKAVQNDLTVSQRTSRQQVTDLECRLSDNENNLRREQERFEQRKADLASQLDSKQGEVAKARAQASALEDERSKLAQRTLKLKQDLDAAANERDSLSSEETQLKANLGRLEESLSKATDEQNATKAELRTKQNELRSLQQKHERTVQTSDQERKQFGQALQEERDQKAAAETHWKGALEERLKTLAKTQALLETAEQKTRRLEDDKQRADNKYGDVQSKLQETQGNHQAEIARLKEAVSHEREDAARLRSELSDTRANLSTQNIDNDTQRLAVTKLEDELDRAQTLLVQSEQRQKMLSDQFNIHDNMELADIQADINRIRAILTDTQAALTESNSAKFGDSTDAHARKEHLHGVQKHLQDAFSHTTKVSSQIVQANKSHQTVVKANALKIQQLEADVEESKKSARHVVEESAADKEKIRSLEIELNRAGEKIVTKDLELQQMQFSEKDFKEQKATLSKSLKTREKNVQLLKEKLLDLEEQVGQATRRSDVFDRELAAALSEKIRVEETCKNTESQLERAKQDNLTLKDALRDAELGIMASGDEAKLLEANLTSRQADLEAAEKALQALNLTHQHAADDAQKQQGVADRAAADVSRIQATLSDAEAEITRQFGEIERLEAANRTAEASLESTNEVHGGLSSSLKQAEGKISSLEAQLAQTHAANERTSTSLQDAREASTDLQTRYGYMQADYDKLMAMYNESAEQTSERDAQVEELRTGNSRLQMLLEEAGRNIREHVETETMSIREIERLRSAVEHAEVASRRAREWVERTTQQHEAARAKIIDRADREIKRQRALLEDCKTQMVSLSNPLDLNILRDSASRVFALLCHVGTASGCNMENFAGLPDVQVQKRGTEIRVVLLWLNAIEGISKALQDTLVLKAPGDQSLRGEAADDTVSRLLNAVKRFHSAKEAGDAIGRGGPSAVNSAMSLAPEQPPQPPQPQERQLAEPSDQKPVGLVLDINDEDLDKKVVFKPFSPLAQQEQEELYKDWKRLKVKAQDLNIRLRSAKAAVAVGRFREETQRTYTRNRDRLVARILLKPAKKSRTLRLLQILSDTAV